MKWKIIDWIVRGLIALAFALASLGKLTANPGVLEMFARFGFPDGFHWFIGILELAGAVLLLIPKTRRIAIMMLAAIVIGAAGTHLVHDPLAELIRPLIFALLLTLAWFLPKKFGERRLPGNSRPL